MIPLYNPQGPQYVLGMPCAQNRLALPTWSYAFEMHRPARIIEIGSGTGGFTIGLAIASRSYKTCVFSIDQTEAPSEEFKTLAIDLEIRFIKADILSEGTTEFIGNLTELPGTTYVLCDGGDKLRELETFSKFLKPGDVIGAHDYFTTHEFWTWTEIQESDARVVAKENNLERWMADVFAAAAWLVYRKT